MQSKNRKILALLSLVCLLSLFPLETKAWQTGGQSGSGGSSGGGTGMLTDGGNYFDSGTYLFEFVYRPEGGSPKVLACAIVYSGEHEGYIGDIASKASASSSANDCKYITSGALQNLALRLYNGENLDTMEPISDKTIAQNYLEQFGLNLNELREKGSEPGDINSYGYRILIQKLTCFGTSGNWCSILYPRKAFANDYPNHLLFGGSWQNDLYTTKDDIGIETSAYQNWQTSRGDCWNDSLCTQLGRNFADYTKGEGYNIIGFNHKIFSNPYDYRPDSLCLDCETTNSNWSYVYTDMANWEGIKTSLSSDDSNIKNYFKSSKRGTKTYACREEIKVKYPDEANKVLVEPGRYFTVGLPQRFSVSVPNFAPITVERTKECHAYDSNYNDVTSSTTASEWTAFWKQDSFYQNKDTGTIKITYKEKNGNKKYDGEENGNKKYDGEKNTKTYNQRVSDITSNILKVTNSYKLAGTTYQYVRLDSGLSVSTKPNVAYIDLGVANFPVSYENKSKNGRKAAVVTLKYELPKNSQLSKSIENSYDFGSNNAVSEDIYKKAATAGAIGNNFIQKGSLDDSQYNDLKHTACVLEYCDANGKNCKSGFNSCMSSKIKTGKTQTNCAKDDYTCDINFKGAECEKKDNKYYIDGQEVSKEEYEANGCLCKIEDGKYCLDMKEVTKEEYEKVADSTCPNNDPCCLGIVNGGCNKIIYRTIDLRNPFPGQDTNKNGRRTGTNWCSYDITTQTLDCSNLNDGITDGIPNAKNPSTTNKTVSKHIKNNAGASEEDIYRQTPQYSITLNSQNIDQIRRYNKEQKKLGGYDDFTLTCHEVNNEEIKSNLKAQGIYTTDICRSDFIRKNEFNFNLSGTCAGSSWDNLLSCSERSVKE